ASAKRLKYDAAMTLFAPPCGQRNRMVLFGTSSTIAVDRYDTQLLVSPGMPRWLILVHRIPPRPLYLRAKMRRRLADVGAVAVKNAVYLLPHGPEALEDLQWI